MIDGGLRQIFRHHLPTFDWQSIESGMTGLGIPDSNYCVDGVEGWVEYKLTSTSKVGLRSEQVGWLLRRSRAGGRTFIAIRYRHSGGPRRGEPVDRLFIYRGSQAKKVLVHGLTIRPLASWAGGPSRWSWDQVSALLQGSRGAEGRG